MPKGPWEVMGPAVPSQTDENIRGRYVNSFKVLAALVIPLLLLTVLVGEDPYQIFLTVFSFCLGVFVWVIDLGVKIANAGVGLLGWRFPAWLSGAHIGGLVHHVVLFLLPFVLILMVVQLLPAVIVWMELKAAAHMQVRLGPMRVGRWHGWAQPFADGIKLFLKEDLVPAKANKWTHFLAPVIVLAPAYICYAPIPFGKTAVVDLDIGLLFVLAVSGLAVVGMLMAGWGSNNKYTVLGGLRAAAQVVSYEIPRVISVLPIVMWAGTMSLSGIMTAQEGLYAGFLPKWFIFYPVVGQISFVIYLITTVAETNRTPFDLAEAEAELVSGFHTEYAGIKFSIFFIAEYAYVFLGCALGALLFLGGGAPLPFMGWIPSYVWFFGKTFFLVFLFIWFRWTFPRIRVDRLMEFCWKFLLPWSLVNIAIAGLLML